MDTELDRLRALAAACKAEWVEGEGWVLPFFTHLDGTFEIGGELLENPKFALSEWIERRRASAAKLGYLHREASALVEALRAGGDVVKAVKDVEILLGLICWPKPSKVED